jgi:subtilisin family serine protease
MRHALAVVVLLLSHGVGAARAGAEEMAAKFWSGGRWHPISVATDHVAVRRTPATPSRATLKLTAKEEQAFAMIGVEVVPRASAADGVETIGVPLWFDKDSGAVGVLTHEMVLRVGDDGAEEVSRALAATRAQDGFAGMQQLGGKTGLYVVKFASPMAALAGANVLAQRAGVRYAHPNFVVPKVWRSAPDAEPLFSHQWHLKNTGQLGGAAGADIHVQGAWAVTLGSPDVLIAVLDGGFELPHPDLDGAWFRNAGEVPGNGVDDDANGYVDDVSGWNFWSDTADPTVGVVDEHGTAVAGLSGGRVNGKGMTGVCPQCTMLPVVVSWQVAEDAAAFRYAAALGADVITNSWGYPIGTPTTDVLVEAIADAARDGRDGKGAIILFAMNNIDKNDCEGAKPDVSSLDTVIAVSASSDLDKKVSFSAWGDCMELLSPSYEDGRKGIATSDLSGTRGYNNGRYPGDLPELEWTNDFGGTSAATPIAAGVFGLMLSVNGELTRDEALAMVLSTADKIQPSLANYDPRTGFSTKYGYGRINAANAVRAAEVFRRFSKGGPKKDDKATPTQALPPERASGERRGVRSL